MSEETSLKNLDSTSEEQEEDKEQSTDSSDTEKNEETHGSFVTKELEDGESTTEHEKKTKHKAGKKKKLKHHKEKHSESISEEEEVDDKPISTEREKAIAAQLAQIYENSDGTMPNMKTFEGRSGGRFVRALVIFLCSCLFFGGAAWAGLFILQPHSQFSEEDVSLTVTGEESVIPGTETTYRVHYRNAQSVGLENAVLEIRYPQGFVVTTSSLPSDSEHSDHWDLGSLDPGSGNFIDITGKFFGDVGSKQSIRAFLSYKPANFTSTFQVVATKTIETKNDVAKIEISIPAEASRGSKIPVTITITPSTDAPLENVALACVSSDFVPDHASTPASDTGEPCTWSFDRLSEKTVIQLSGVFGSPSSSSEFGVELRGWNSKDHTGESFVLGNATQSLALVDSATNVSLVINGGSGDMNISPGETIAASIVVQNKGESALTDVSIDAVIDGPSYSNRSILGWQDLKLTGDAEVGGEQLAPDTRRGKITWDKRFVPGLASIPPGGQVQVDVSIPIRSGDQITLANFTTNNIVFFSNFSYGKTGERKTVASNQINLTLVSDFALKADHEFTPTSGAAGLYSVSWTLSNSFHPLKNIVLEADVYGDVDIDKSKIIAGAGTATYDEKNKRITWSIPEMPTAVDVLNLEFDIHLKSDNPTQKDLMSKIRMSAEDDTTHVTIKKVEDGIPLR